MGSGRRALRDLRRHVDLLVLEDECVSALVGGAQQQLTLSGGRDGEARCLTGLAALFGVVATVRPVGRRRFREEVAAGAFDRSIREDDVRALINHDPKQDLGGTRDGQLRLWTDRIGLRFKLTPTPTHAAMLFRAVERGKVAGMSFRFRRRAVEEYRGVRRLIDVELNEITFVFTPLEPVYSGTSAELAPPTRLDLPSVARRRKRLERLAL